MNKIQKVISVGDEVFTPTGRSMRITKVCCTGFFCGDNYYSYDEHRKKYWLTAVGIKSEVCR